MCLVKVAAQSHSLAGLTLGVRIFQLQIPEVLHSPIMPGHNVATSKQSLYAIAFNLQSPLYEATVIKILEMHPIANYVLIRNDSRQRELI